MFLSKIFLMLMCLLSANRERQQKIDKEKSAKLEKKITEEKSSNTDNVCKHCACHLKSQHIDKSQHTDVLKQRREDLREKYEIDELIETAKEMFESIEEPLDVAANAGADMLSAVKRSSYILYYFNALMNVLTQKMNERNWMILINLLLVLMFLFAYVVFTRFLLNFMDDYIDMNEFMFTTARWTIAYILAYIVVIVMKWSPQVMSILNCLLTLAAATDMLDVITNIILERYKQYQFFIRKLFVLVQSILTAFAIIFTLYYFVEIFRYDNIIFQGALQLFILCSMSFMIVFLFTVRDKAGKLIARYIKQKQKQSISLKKDLTDLLFFNVLNFAIDIWFWLILFFIILIALLFFISLKFLTLLFKLTAIVLLTWMYYVSMRLLKGNILLFIKEHALYQRYIIHRLLDRVFPVVKVSLGFFLACSCIFIFDFYTKNVIYAILISKACQLGYLVIGLWLCVQLFVFCSEYYCFIIAYPVSLLTKNPIARIAGYIFRVTSGLTSIMIIVAWLGYDPLSLSKSTTFLFAGISFIFQTSIRDIVNGALLAIDNTIELGDIIELDGHLGIVEALTLFSVKVRVENGMLVTMRYSDIGKIGNKSRSYCFAIINASVAYENNLDDVIGALHEVYSGIKNGHQLGKKILSPIEIRGVTKLNGDEVIVQCRFKTKPRFDMPITRLFYIYLKQKFDQSNIRVSDPRLIISEESMEDHVAKHQQRHKKIENNTQSKSDTVK